MKKEKTGSLKMWLLAWGLGVAGQICWNMENQWFNTFVYAKIGKNPSIITAMLICSAAVTTFSTFFFGTLSDRRGRRRGIVGWGFVLWGVFTIAFGMTEFINARLVFLTGSAAVLADMVMSFFGSMAYDCGFNAWINDRITDRNRGQLGGVMAAAPVLGTIIGTVAGGALIGADDNYMRLFLVMGGGVILFGVAALLTMDKGDEPAPSVRGTFRQQFWSVFDFKSFVKQRELLWVFIAIACFFTGFNTYFAYIGNYIIYYLGYSADMMGLIEAIPLVLAMLTAIPLSKLINRDRHPIICIAGAVVSAAGLCFLIPLTPAQVDPSKLFNLPLWLGCFLCGAGYIAVLQTTRVWAKQLYPADSRGQYEGVWIVFFVLLPMIVGSLLGEAAVRGGGETYVDAVSGQLCFIPNGGVFIAGAAAMLIDLIPFFTARPLFRRRVGSK